MYIELELYPGISYTSREGHHSSETFHTSRLLVNTDSIESLAEYEESHGETVTVLRTKTGKNYRMRGAINEAPADLLDAVCGASDKGVSP